MNLWAKRTGQLLFVAVLFLMSCEDDTYFLGFQNELKKFEVKFKEFNLINGSIISVDSVATDNNSTFKRLLIGEVIDPIVGTIRTEAFTQIIGDGLKIVVKEDHTYVYDSVVLSLHLDNYSYGLEGNAIGKYNVHRVTSDLSYTKDEIYPLPGTDKDVLVKIPTNYHASSTVQYSNDLLGQTRFRELFYFNKKEKNVGTTITASKLLTNADTLIASTRLTNTFGEELFFAALNNVDDEFSNPTKFKTAFKGLAIIPNEANTVLGFNPLSKFSRVRLYYHSELSGAVKDTLIKDFSLSGVSFHSIKSNRNPGFPSSDQPYIGIDNDQRIVQNGDVMATKIDLENFYSEFANIVNDDNILINSAELVIESVVSSEQYPPIPVLELRLMNDSDDYYLNYKKLTQTQRDSLTKFFISTDGKNYFVNNDFYSAQNPLIAGLVYNSSKNSYSGSITFLIQNLFNNRFSNYKLKYLALYPGTSRTGSTSTLPIGKTLNRSIFSNDKIKLRVYYTQANKSNL